MKKKNIAANAIVTDQFYVKINHIDDEEITRHATRAEYDNDDIKHFHTINGFQLSHKDRGWDFILNEDPTGKQYFLVYVLYDGGDSFHCEEDLICMVSFVRDFEDAKTIALAIEEDYKKYRESDLGNYKPLQIHLPIANRIESLGGTSTWKGYFDRLSSVHVEPMGSMKMSIHID